MASLARVRGTSMTGCGAGRLGDPVDRDGIPIRVWIVRRAVAGARIDGGTG